MQRSPPVTAGDCRGDSPRTHQTLPSGGVVYSVGAGCRGVNSGAHPAPTDRGTRTRLSGRSSTVLVAMPTVAAPFLLAWTSTAGKPHSYKHFAQYHRFFGHQTSASRRFHNTHTWVASLQLQQYEVTYLGKPDDPVTTQKDASGNVRLILSTRTVSKPDVPAKHQGGPPSAACCQSRAAKRAR